MVREDLIEGAITFLQDASVAAAPIEQKISFLRSKNLTEEEIDVSLSRVGQSPTAQAQLQSNAYAQQYRQSPNQYGGYQQQQQQQSPWGQPASEVPRRDWRDWFIMATVTSGLGYAMYWTARRYIYPLIAPPTPPQLEQDKASIDASFDKAFALLDQLAADTQELKDAEKERKGRLDHALSEVESVVSKMKEANENRELEAKRIAREIEEIKEQIPMAIQREKETTDGRLKDLTVEMKSLKTLVGNRMGQRSAPVPSWQSSTPDAVNGASKPLPTTRTGSIDAYNGTPGSNGTTEDGEKSATAPPERSATSSPSGRMLGGKAQIPAWQLAAKKKKEEAGMENINGVAPGAVIESGTVADVDGAGP